jgi:hypothetical protein
MQMIEKIEIMIMSIVALVLYFPLDMVGSTIVLVSILAFLVYQVIPKKVEKQKPPVENELKEYCYEVAVSVMYNFVLPNALMIYPDIQPIHHRGKSRLYSHFFNFVDDAKLFANSLTDYYYSKTNNPNFVYLTAKVFQYELEILHGRKLIKQDTQKEVKI